MIGLRSKRWRKSELPSSSWVFRIDKGMRLVDDRHKILVVAYFRRRYRLYPRDDCRRVSGESTRSGSPGWRTAEFPADEGVVYSIGSGRPGGSLEVFEEGENLRAAGFGLDEGAGAAVAEGGDDLVAPAE